MPPKNSMPISKSDQLSEVDAELESAMERLSKTNEGIEDLLTRFEDPEAYEETERESQTETLEEVQAEPIAEATPPEASPEPE